MKSYDKLFIGGEWTASSGTGTIEVINPTTEEVCGSVPDSTEADIERPSLLLVRHSITGPGPG